MTSPLNFAPQSYPGGRILLMLGKHEVGAVFPPCGSPPDRLPWVWRFWTIGNGLWRQTTDGRAKTELAAKNAILACAEQWLRDAGVGG